MSKNYVNDMRQKQIDIIVNKISLKITIKYILR